MEIVPRADGQTLKVGGGERPGKAKAKRPREHTPQNPGRKERHFYLWVETSCGCLGGSLGDIRRTLLYELEDLDLDSGSAI